MVLETLEGVNLEQVQIPLSTEQERAAIGDLPQKQRVSAVDDRQVERLAGKEALNIHFEIDVRVERGRESLEKDGDVHVALRMSPARHRRPEPHPQTDPLP